MSWEGLLKRHFRCRCQPAFHNNGYHKFTAVYDDRSNRVEERYFGADSQPVLSKAGYHIWKAGYDARDNQIEWAYFDTEGRPVVDSGSGFHRISKVRDEFGRIIEEAYFGADGKPMLDKNGYHKYISRFEAGGVLVEKSDDLGRVVSKAYFDPDWKPILNPAGYHRYMARYDARGNQIEWAYFDTKGQPVIDRDSDVHRMNKVYDELSRVVQEASFSPTVSRPTCSRRVTTSRERERRSAISMCRTAHPGFLDSDFRSLPQHGSHARWASAR